jgi:hypothetical protein
MLYSTINNMNNVIAKLMFRKAAAKGPGKGAGKGITCFLLSEYCQLYQFSYLKDKSALVAPIYTEPSTTGLLQRKIQLRMFIL